MGERRALAFVARLLELADGGGDDDVVRTWLVRARQDKIAKCRRLYVIWFRVYCCQSRRQYKPSADRAPRRPLDGRTGEAMHRIGVASERRASAAVNLRSIAT